VDVLIRADASATMGSGHIARTLTLARSLRDAGAAVSFVTRRHAGNLIELCLDSGFETVALEIGTGTAPAEAGPAHAEWLGSSWQEDADATTAAIARRAVRPGWLIVDHYALDERWERALRPQVERIMVIDDLADRRHDCDLLLDQNLVDDADERYRDKVAETCALMLGPRYALLQPLYAELHERVAVRVGPIRRVLICFGGGDCAGLAQNALRAFLDMKRPDVACDLVVATEDSVLDALARGHGNVRVHRRLPSLAPLMADAQLAVGGAGATSWERMCLGLPAIVVTLADNQVAIARTLHRGGYARWLGPVDAVSGDDLRQALQEAFDQGADSRSSRLGWSTVDGRGLWRVRAALLLDDATPLAIRRAGWADEDLLLEWANDPETRRRSSGRARIAPQEHHRWLASRLDSDDCLLLVGETTDGVPLGTVRFERSRDAWQVSYSVAAAYRGRGLARRMVESAVRELVRRRGPCQITARVMADNARSHSVFSHLGFEVNAADDPIIEYRRAFAASAS
jgi:UDP-2,4-diacetamido-2,4,6-trideoxy-beta-L-altropyranose hydrolase